MYNKEPDNGSVCGPAGCEVTFSSQAGERPPMTDAHRLDLTIVSDVICPWCYVAKRRLEKALELVGPSLQVRVCWRPFELNPQMPKAGLDRRTYRSKKFGSWDASLRLDAQVTAAGAEDGLAFRHDLMSRTPNTFDAHRLIWLAGQEGAQDAVVEALFRAYFSEGRDVGDHGVLADLAETAGLNRSRVVTMLDDNTGSSEVSDEERAARMAGISGVPTFIANGQALFSGAQRATLMADRLREVVHSNVAR